MIIVLKIYNLLSLIFQVFEKNMCIVIRFLAYHIGAIELLWQTKFLTGSALLDHRLILILHVARVFLL